MELNFDRTTSKYVVIHDDIFDQENFMYPTYRHLVDVLSEVIHQANYERLRLHPDTRPSMYSGFVNSYPRGHCDISSASIASDLYRYGNNVIVVSGRRGQGKTSAMLTLSNAMATEANGSQQWKKRFGNHTFVVLDPIDPTVLEDKASPLMLILSRMYRMAEESWSQYLAPGMGEQRISDSLKSRLVEQFQKCFSGIRAIKAGEDIKSIASLHELSDSSQLKVSLYILVEELLGFCTNTSDGRKTLVIQLDDTDFQIGKGYEVLDDIRKYLTLPNVVILLATDMDLMYKVVAQHFTQELATAINHGLVSELEIENNAHKYLDKLVPPSQVVYLPHVDGGMSQPNEKLLLRLRDNNRCILPIEREESLPLEDSVLRFLYRKTGILCVSREGEYHSFIPSTFRGLMQLLDLLAALQDLPVIDDEQLKYREYFHKALRGRLEIKERNLAVFEDYFLNSWINAKFSSSEWRKRTSQVRGVMKRIVNEVGLDDACMVAVKTLNVCRSLWEEGSGDTRWHGGPCAEPDHEKLFSKVWGMLHDEHGKLDRCFAAAIYIAVALRWHKSVTQRMLLELPSILSSADTYAFTLSPAVTGLPKSFWLNKSDANDYVQSALRDLLNDDKGKDGDKRIASLIAPDEEFRVLHLVQVFLSMAGENGSTPLVAYGDISQHLVYNVQEAMLTIACNPEVARELIIKEEESTRIKKPNGEAFDRWVRNVSGAINFAERSLNSGCADPEIPPLILEHLLFGRTKEWLDQDDPSLSNNAVSVCFDVLHNKINRVGELESKLRDIYEKWLAYADAEHSTFKELTRDEAALAIQNFIKQYIKLDKLNGDTSDAEAMRLLQELLSDKVRDFDQKTFRGHLRESLTWICDLLGCDVKNVLPRDEETT